MIPKEVLLKDLDALIRQMVKLKISPTKSLESKLEFYAHSYWVSDKNDLIQFDLDVVISICLNEIILIPDYIQVKV